MNKDEKKSVVQRFKLKLALLLAMLATLPSMVSAQAINFTSVVEILESVVDIFPPLVDIIIAVVPILVVVAIVSFVLGLFGAILSGITDAFRSLK